MSGVRTFGYIFIVLCAFVIFASIQTNSVIKKQLKQSTKDYAYQAQKKIYKGVPAVQPKAVPQQEQRIKPEDPAKYGMVVLSKRDAPNTLEQWEIKLSAEFDSRGVFEGEAAQVALAKMKRDYSQYEQQMLELDNNIAVLEQQMKDDPLNEKLEEKLQNFYKVKAINKIIARKILQPPDQPTQPSPPSAADATVPPLEN